MNELQLQFKRETGISPDPDTWEVEYGERIIDEDGDDWDLLIVWKNFESVDECKPFDVYPEAYIEWLEEKLTTPPRN